MTKMAFMAVLALGVVFGAVGQADAVVVNQTNFNTGADAAILTGQIEGYWTFSTNRINWQYDQNTTTSANVGPNCPYEGAAYGYTEASSGQAADEWYAVTPVLDLDAYIYTIDFYWDKHHNGTTTCTLAVELSTDGGSTFPTTLFTTTQDDGAGGTAANCNVAVDWHNQVIDLSPYSGNNAVVRIRAASGGAFQCDTAIDLITTDRVARCTDTVPSNLQITVPPANNATVGGVVTITATADEAMSGMTASVSGTTGGICDVAGQAMSGTGPWTYSWDTSACGDPVENPITITVNGNEPECGFAQQAQWTNITIDNTDADPATLTITAPTSGATVGGVYTVQVQVGTEASPATMTSMAVSVTGAGACNVSGGAMSWNPGNSLWEYAWNTSACGTVAPVTGVVIDASGNDPDNGALKNAPQVGSITIDNTDPSKIANCGGCHGYPPLDGSARNNPEGAVIGDHQKHLYACATCHVTPATETSADFGHRNGNIEMASPIFSGTGSYTRGTSFAQTNNPITETCSNVNCHGGQPTPQWGPGGPIPCSGCHTNDMGLSANVRRGMYDAGNDFSLASQHGSATPADTDCAVCHNRSNHVQEGDPAVRVFDGDNAGTSYVYNGTGSSLEAFCESCHDADGASRIGANPFSGAGSPPNIGWTVGATAHSAVSGVCFGCHGKAGAGGGTLDPAVNAHGSTKEKLMALAGYTNSATFATTSQNTCYDCHGNAGGATDNIQALFAKTYAHGDQNCIVCHDLHKATDANPLNGVSGVTPTQTAAGTPTGYTGPAAVTDPDEQYKVCFRCHTDWSGGPVGTTQNVARFFNPLNDSQHCVESDLHGGPEACQVNTGSPQQPGIWHQATFNLTDTATSGARLIDVMIPRAGVTHTDASLRSRVLRCSDCHGDNVADTGVPEGPHGSAGGVGPTTILKIPAGSPYTTWDANSDVGDTNVWCFNCHSPTFAGSGFAGASDHIDHDGRANNEPCQGCHLRIPHGSDGDSATDNHRHLLNPGNFNENADNENSGSWSEHGPYADCPT